ncbi:MAG: FAD-dependent oxidoreductase [Patescibacteria group bacterium]|nr:FAD-dependent oxidoreductase [Patescibacteria group bacterium]
MENQLYDVVIVGGGPAGLTSAIYTSRRAMKTLVISRDIGGQLSLTDDVENYPGFESIGGLELSQKFQVQAAKTGVEFLFEGAENIIKEDSGFLLETSSGKKIKARSIILAFGLTPRSLGVPGEKELSGRGVTYCATCDGPLYRGKEVVVVGGGNSALDAAEYMSKIAKKVYMLARGELFRGEQILVDQVKTAANVEIFFRANVKEIKGKDRVEAVVFSVEGQEDKEIPVDGIFVEIGHVAKSDWLAGLGVALNERREIIINSDNETNVKGVFAAGDITEVSYKQAVISAGEGCKAALQAYRYLQGGKPLTPDWTPKK